MAEKNNSILAIDPGTREMGFACFDGSELVDFGVRSIRQGSLPIILRHVGAIVERLISEKRPYDLAYEKNAFSQIRQNYRLVRAIYRIESVAHRHNVRTFSYDPRTVRKVVSGNGNLKKRELARCVAFKYPETRIYLKGRNVTQERFWLNAFDAIGCGLAYLKLEKQQTQRNSHAPFHQRS